LRRSRSDSPARRPVVCQASLGDVEIAYTELGGDFATALAEDGEPLVLLHGLTGHRDDFAPGLPRLRERHPKLRLLAPDLRGHGDSTHSGEASPFTFERLVDDLGCFLERLGVGRCHLLGHSVGGMIALRFALAHPTRLASLLLVSTAPFAPEGHSVELFEKTGAIACARGMAFLQALVEQRQRGAEAGSAADDRATARWGGAWWPHHRHRYRSMDPVAYRELGLAMVRQTSLVPRLGELVLPVTVIVGEHDDAFLPGADALARGIPGATRVDVPLTGHHPHRENEDVWLDAVSAHLERAGRRG
jgi:pimeloyl-ACP methyl ester carboxylesterase